jgi:peroxiredoxin
VKEVPVQQSRLFASATLLAIALFASACAQQATPAPRSADQIEAAIEADTAQLDQVLPNPLALENAGRRIALGPVVAPVLRKLVADIGELAAVSPDKGKDDLWGRTTALAQLTVLGDRAAPIDLAQLARSADPAESQHAWRGQLVARWILAIDDDAAQGKIVDGLEQLDVAHPDSRVLTMATVGFANSAATPELKSRLLKMAYAMNNPEVARVRTMEERQQKLASVIEAISKDKPLVLTGKTIDGNDLTTTAWKGKVILVVFWATWCNPCVGEVPRVKEIYAEYHAKGLEVLGVSSDYNATVLADFLAKNDMPWPQLYDSAAAAKQKLNPAMGDLGIQGIPRMFLIGRKGICRTVEARGNMERLIPQLLVEPG